MSIRMAMGGWAPSLRWRGGHRAGKSDAFQTVYTNNTRLFWRKNIQEGTVCFTREENFEWGEYYLTKKKSDGGENYLGEEKIILAK